jgi:hypothetical protein
MTVEQTWRHGRTGGIDLLIAVKVAADRHDPAILNDDIGRGGFAARAVKDQATSDQRACHGVRD